MLGPTLSNTDFLFYEGKARHREMLDLAQQIRSSQRSTGYHARVVCRFLVSLGQWLMETGLKLQEKADRRLVLQARQH